MIDRDLVVFVIENASYNRTEKYALRRLLEQGHDVRVFPSVGEANEQLKPIEPNKKLVCLTDLYMPAPDTGDWVRSPKARRHGEIAAGSPFSTRAVNVCIPTAIVTSESHSKNPFLFLFHGARLGYASTGEPAWIIVLEAEIVAVPDYRYVEPLDGVMLPLQDKPSNGIVRCEVVKTDDREVPFTKMGLAHLRALLRKSESAKRWAGRLHLHRWIRAQPTYAAYNPATYDAADPEASLIGYFPGHKTHPIKDWGEALERRLATPVPVRRECACDIVYIDE